MIISVIKETKPGENRVALTPDVANELVKKGFAIHLETGAGEKSFFFDKQYADVGAQIAASVQDLLPKSDVLICVNQPSESQIGLLKKGAILISLIYTSPESEWVKSCVKQGITVFSVNAIPRISRAQKMDALSSQSNLAGYKTVMLASNALGKIFPMLMTAAGTIKPTKVLIMGAGVAGLQAIATAKRLGALVEVSDIRPETKEQVQSLGATFIEVKSDDSMVTEGGYVKQVSEEFLKKQQALVAKHAAEADIIITTALIPGKKAPVLITEEMVKSMRAGSVIVDMATEQGGNCALSEMDKTVVKHNVTIIGESNLPSLLPQNASQLYAKNMSAFLTHLATAEKFNFDLEEEITKGSLLIHNGAVVHSTLSV